MKIYIIFIIVLPIFLIKNRINENEASFKIPGSIFKFLKKSFQELKFVIKIFLEFFLYIGNFLEKTRWFIYFIVFYLGIDLFITFLNILGWITEPLDFLFLWKLFLFFYMVFILKFDLFKTIELYLLLIVIHEFFIYLKNKLANELILRIFLTIILGFFIILIASIAFLPYIGTPSFFNLNIPIQSQIHTILFEALKKYYLFNGLFLTTGYYNNKNKGIVLLVGSRIYTLAEIAKALNNKHQDIYRNILCKALKQTNPYDFIWVIVKESFNPTTIKEIAGNRTSVYLYKLPIFYLTKFSYPKDYITNFQLSPLDKKFYKKYTQELYKKYCSK